MQLRRRNSLMTSLAHHCLNLKEDSAALLIAVQLSGITAETRRALGIDAQVRRTQPDVGASFNHATSGRSWSHWPQSQLLFGSCRRISKRCTRAGGESDCCRQLIIRKFSDSKKRAQSPQAVSNRNLQGTKTVKIVSLV